MKRLVRLVLGLALALALPSFVMAGAGPPPCERSVCVTLEFGSPIGQAGILASLGMNPGAWRLVGPEVPVKKGDLRATFCGDVPPPVVAGDYEVTLLVQADDSGPAPEGSDLVKGVVPTKVGPCPPGSSGGGELTCPKGTVKMIKWRRPVCVRCCPKRHHCWHNEPRCP